MVVNKFNLTFSLFCNISISSVCRYDGVWKRFNEFAKYKHPTYESYHWEKKKKTLISFVLEKKVEFYQCIKRN